MKDSDFIFDCVYLLNYKCHKINRNRGWLYIDSSDWIKKQKATLNHDNDDDKFIQFAATVALSYEIITTQTQRISKITPIYK